MRNRIGILNPHFYCANFYQNFRLFYIAYACLSLSNYLTYTTRTYDVLAGKNTQLEDALKFQKICLWSIANYVFVIGIPDLIQNNGQELVLHIPSGLPLGFAGEIRLRLPCRTVPGTVPVLYRVRFTPYAVLLLISNPVEQRCRYTDGYKCALSERELR